jgi:hypothetical protein
VVLVDFTVSTDGGCCGYVNTRASTWTSLLAGPSGGAWTLLEAHPCRATLLLATPAGLLVTFNHLTNEKVGEVQLELGEEVTALKYSPDGSCLALGTR